MNLKQIKVKIIEKIGAFEENPKSPAIYCLVGSFFYVMAGFFIKKLQGIPATQILYFRSIISMIINTFIIKLFKHDIYPKDKTIFKRLLMRCIFGGMAHVCYYQGISLLNLSDAQAIFLSSPIWTTLLARIMLGEQLLPGVVNSIILCFVGIIMVIKPPFLFSMFGLEETDTQSNPYQMFGYIVSIAFSFLESLSSVMIRSLSSTVQLTAIIQYVYISGFAFNATIMIIHGQFHEEIFSRENLPFMFAVAIINYTAQMIASRGFQIGKLQNVVPFTYIQLVLSFLVDIFIFHKELNMFSLIGSGLILVGNYQILMRI